VIPGVIACGLVYLIARRMFDTRVALATALLFTFAHWSVRLSRYGWDVCWMIALFAAALWLAEEGSFVAGIAAGLSLYTYLGARARSLYRLADARSTHSRTLHRVYRRTCSTTRQACSVSLMHSAGEPSRWGALRDP